VTGTMMDYPLTITSLFERAGKLFPSVEIVSRRPDNSIHRYAYGDWYRRSRALAGALQNHGVRPGDRVATLMWNHYAHLEAYFAVPVVGAVLHTLNLRLHPDELTYIINDAEDRILIIDDVLLPLFEKVKDRVKIEIVIVFPFSESSVPQGYEDYETLLEHSDGDPRYVDLKEDDAVSMCYTSGTTGKPKGVVYSHRAIALHSYSISLPDNFSISRNDAILPAMSMFHANGWGLPFAAVMNGSKLVLPGPNLQPELILDLLSSEQVTLTGAVPTVWLAVAEALERESQRWRFHPELRVLIGGSACPEILFRRFDRFGVRVIQLWGLTETTPTATVSRLQSHMQAASEDERYRLRARQGMPMPFLEVRGVGDSGEVPWDGTTPGELELRGPTVAASYYKLPEESCKWSQDGWFRTGDVAMIDSDGYLKITDRAKDLIKSGGEWISSVDLENALVAHPSVAEAAIVAVPHPKWQERPLALVVRKKGAEVDEEELRRHLASTFAKWQLPDDFVFVTDLPHTSTGKLLKSELRQTYREWNWQMQSQEPRDVGEKPERKPEQPTSTGQSIRYRVDTVPRLVRPFYLAVTWAIGAVLYLYYRFCRITSTISIEGPGDRDLSQHAIFCMWHESWWSYFVVFQHFRSSHAMISHPAAYMRPLHCVFRWMGLKRLLLGSSGEEGRRAVNELAGLVRSGWSTTISPDGPSGPARSLKKGVLHIALQSGVPIVPLTISASRFVSFPSWDCKKHPLPFNRIRVFIHNAICVDRHNFNEIGAEIVSVLGGPQKNALT
jgi:fatty-acyl-CoA synthase